MVTKSTQNYSFEVAFDQFVEVANEVCQQLERAVASPFDFRLRYNLIRLLSSAEELSDVVGCPEGEGELTEHLVPHLSISKEIYFHVMFDPLDSTSACTATLADGLGDVYKSLKNGLLNLNQDSSNKEMIAWKWKEDFTHHWRRHLIDCIRFLSLTESP